MKEINIMEEKQLSEEVYILRSIAIILMVAGHAYVASREFIYLFHMAVFLMASGLYWNSKNSENLESVKKYTIKVIKRLYLPYLLCNSIYIILNNLFVYICVYTDNPLFLDLCENTIYPQKLTDYLSFGDTIKEFIAAALFGRTAKIGGATWFLYVLFLICVGHCIVNYIFFLLKLKRKEVSIYCLLIVIFLFIAWLIQQNYLVFLPRCLKRMPAAYVAFLMGVLLRKSVKYWHKYCNSFVACICFITLVIMQFFGSIELSSCKIVNPVFYVISSLLGWFLLISVGGIIIRTKYITHISKYLIIAGKRTLPVVLMHFLAFKIVSIGYIFACGKSMFYLASFPVIFDTPYFVKYLYISIGIVVPLILYRFYEKIKSKIKEQNSL